MTDDDLQAIRARLEQTTPGEWHHGTNVHGQHNVWADGGDDVTPAWCDTRLGRPMTPEDCEFIANAKQDVAALLAEVERLRAAVAAERESCAQIAESYTDSSQGIRGARIRAIAVQIRARKS